MDESSMTPLDLARAFLEKGREDEVLLERLVSDRDVTDAIFGFHAQQAAEKCIKAVLAIEQVRPARTHDLTELFDEVRSEYIEVPEEFDQLKEWSVFAVDDRYPSNKPPLPVNRADALTLVVSVRTWAQTIIDAHS